MRLSSHIFSHRHYIALLCVSFIIGYSMGMASPAAGLWFASPTRYNLMEESGGEKASSLKVTGSSSNWYNCNGSNCKSNPSSVKIDYSVVDGSSHFWGVWGKYAGGGAYSCSGDYGYLWVDAGPSGPGSTGSRTVYLSGSCPVGIGVPWFWQGGMCDSQTDCIHSHQAIYGPRITWYWAPTGSSAFNIQYWW